MSNAINIQTYPNIFDTFKNHYQNMVADYQKKSISPKLSEIL